MNWKLVKSHLQGAPSLLPNDSWDGDRVKSDDIANRHQCSPKWLRKKSKAVLAVWKLLRLLEVTAYNSVYCSPLKMNTTDSTTRGSKYLFGGR